MTDKLPLPRPVVWTTVAAVALALGGCATVDPAHPSSATPAGASATADAGRPQVSASGTSVPSVAPGTVLQPKDFVAQLRGAMNSASSYEFMTTSKLSDPTATQTGPAVRTIVDQHDPSTQKVRTITTNGSTSTELILIGNTQYLRTGDGKFQRSQVPPEAGQGLVAVGLDIENGARSVTYVGPDNVEGQLARHYTADMPPQGASQAAGQSADSSGEHMSYDLWLDAQGRLIKVVTVMTMLTTTQIYSNYDSAPAVTAPDPAQIQG